MKEREREREEDSEREREKIEREKEREREREREQSDGASVTDQTLFECYARISKRFCDGRLSCMASSIRQH